MISMSVVSDARSRSAAEFAFAFGVVLRGVQSTGSSYPRY
jgi:hypothetical protein